MIKNGFIPLLLCFPLWAETYDIDPQKPYAPVSKGAPDGIRVPTLEVHSRIQAITVPKVVEKNTKTNQKSKKLEMKGRSISAQIQRPHFEWKREELRPQIMERPTEHQPLESIIHDALSF